MSCSPPRESRNFPQVLHSFSLKPFRKKLPQSWVKVMVLSKTIASMIHYSLVYQVFLCIVY